MSTLRHSGCEVRTAEASAWVSASALSDSPVFGLASAMACNDATVRRSSPSMAVATARATPSVEASDCARCPAIKPYSATPESTANGRMPARATSSTRLEKLKARIGLGSVG